MTNRATRGEAILRAQNILVGCEWSGTVRDALRELGHNAWSVDLEDVEPEGKWKNYHLFGNVEWFLEGPPGGGKWDAALFFPPCTFLCNSGVRWLFKGGKAPFKPEPDLDERGNAKYRDLVRWKQMEEGAAFFKRLGALPIPKIARENPVMHKYGARRVGERPTQIIQPWQFGHGEVKATGLYLKGLPPLQPTKIVKGRHAMVHLASPGPDRGKVRGKTYAGVGDAMALQWFGKVTEQ